MVTPENREAFIDYYEFLQLSPNANSDTIGRVFRFLAKRYHPDNKKTGNDEKFRTLMNAYRVLSDPEQRAAYDSRYEETRNRHWKAFVEASPSNGVEADGKVQAGILLLLYSARRQNALNPGVGTFELQRLLACPENQIEFHVWYLREKGWIQRTENGTLAITATGVDTVTKSATRLKDVPLLSSGDSAISQNSASQE